MSTGIYQKPTIINPSLHGKYKIAPAKNYQFAQNLNAVFVAGVEFADACKEYPVVFTETPEGTLPLVMLGMREQQNLFLDDSMQWDADYVPAYIRRYPFVLAKLDGLTQGNQLGVCVDEAYEGWNTQSGEALFEATGVQTTFLKSSIEFLTRFQAEHAKTVEFGKRLNTLGLLKSMDATATLNDGQTYTMSGFKVVDEAKLASLTKTQVHELAQSGLLFWIHAHLISLSNMRKLLDRLAAVVSVKA